MRKVIHIVVVKDMLYLKGAYKFGWHPQKKIILPFRDFPYIF